MTEELTLSIIKPDAVKRNLTGKINSMFEKKTLSIVAQKMILLSRLDAERFYGVHKERAFFNDLCDYMTSGPIIVQVLKGKNAVLKNRELMGATNPANADENTVRKMFGLSVEENSVHGSDSPENAEIEINFFFSDREILDH
jgi:nucleoside-diphosphate kinase